MLSLEEKAIEQLERISEHLSSMGEKEDYTDIAIQALEQTMWIPVSERLPEEAYGCIVTVMDTNPMTLEEFENIYPDFVGWDGENWNDADGDSIPFEVIAWMPLPQPYKAESKTKQSLAYADQDTLMSAT